MKKNRPTLTVFSLCYNTGDYVIEGLESFLSFRFEDFEMIVIDDCSSDDSANKVSSWLSSNVPASKYVFVRHEKNQGICKTMNEVLSLATGEFFSGICDDLWEEGRLDDLRLFQMYPEVGLIFCNAKIIDRNSVLTGALYGNSSFLRSLDENDSYLTELYKGNYILPPTCIYRTDTLKALGGYDENLIFEDWDMFLRFAKSGARIKYVDHDSVRYRKHGSSLWQSRSKSLFISIIALFEKHGLFSESDSFVSYMWHFSELPISSRLDYLKWVLVNKGYKMSIVVFLTFIKAPSRLRFLVFRILFKPKVRAWNTSQS